MEHMVYVSEEEKIRYAYDRRYMAELDEAAREAALVEDTASTYLAKGKAEGKEEEKEATVKRLAAESSDISMIARVADLTEAEVLKILG